MRPTADQLRAFYATLRGRRTARALARLVAPHVKTGPTARLLALGYPGPLLTGLDPARFERLIVAMPSAQGAHRWPARPPNHAVTVDPLNLPFEAGLFDQALLVHALEYEEPPQRLLRELWRILSPASELLVMVPNRLGLVTRLGTTPFARGQSYTHLELNHLLTAAMFAPEAQRTAIFPLPMAPPFGGVRLALARKTDGLAPTAIGVVSQTTVLRPA